MISADIKAYNKKLVKNSQAICVPLAAIIDQELKATENKIWHAHPVWFIEGNPIVGYQQLKDCIRLLFWSGQSFEEDILQAEGSFKAAEIRYTDASQINAKDLKRLMKKARTIQWDYKNLIKRKGKLERLVKAGSKSK